jgi:large subunit ribosomal protein L17
MRHRKNVIKLGRTAAHRKATLSNLASGLFERKHIETTVAKAKAVKPYAERLITLAKKNTLHARRLAFALLHRKDVVKMLFDDIAPQFKDRNGGYTRLVKLGQRSGDGAPIAILELVGFDTASKKHKEKEAKKEEAKKKKAKETKAEAAAEAKPKKEDKKEKGKEADKEKKKEKEAKPKKEDKTDDKKGKEDKKKKEKEKEKEKGKKD